MTIAPIQHEPHASAPASAAGGLRLQSEFVPTNNAAGGVFRIVEKDTGRVVLQLPGNPAPPVETSGPARAVDVKA